MGVWRRWARVRENVSRSRSGQIHRHFDGRYRCKDRTRHYGHQWLLGCVPRSRRARLHTPRRQPQHRVHWPGYWRQHHQNREHLTSREGLSNPYNRKGLHSPTCPLYVRGEVKGGASGPCTKCLHPVATTDWSLFSPAPSASCADRCAPGQHTSSAASYTTGTCACARQQQAIREQGSFGVFSATTKHHGFTIGTNDLLRRPPHWPHAGSISIFLCTVWWWLPFIAATCVRLLASKNAHRVDVWFVCLLYTNLNIKYFIQHNILQYSHSCQSFVSRTVLTWQAAGTLIVPGQLQYSWHSLYVS